MSNKCCECYTSDGRCLGTKEIDPVGCCGNEDFCIYSEQKGNKELERKISITGDLPYHPGLTPSISNDAVNHPSHYTSGNIEVADAIIDWKLDFLRGNVVKYIARAGKKSQGGMSMKEKELQDLKKALWYLNKAVEVLEKP